MAYKLSLAIICAALPCAIISAQEKKDTLTLNEVVVKGSRIVNRKDGTMRFLPSEKQKKSSNDGYGLLAKLAMPNVKVDEINRSATLTGNLGQLEIRINDVPATRQDLVSLDIASVASVDYIRDPGARYGQSVTRVINIRTRAAISGYAIGGSAMQAMTAKMGEGNAYVKFNKGYNEFSADASFGYNNIDGGLSKGIANYLMSSGQVIKYERNDIKNNQRTNTNDLRLRFSSTDGDRYSFLATLSGSWKRNPENTTTRQTTGPDGTILNTISDTEKSFSPTIDVYFNTKLTDNQTITGQATASHANSDYAYSFAEGSPYSYTSDGKSWETFGELIYENRLKPFTFSAGAHYNGKFVNNTYYGDIATKSDINNSETYAFAQIKGELWLFSYSLSAGAMLKNNHQDDIKQNYVMWNPRLSVTYKPRNEWLLSYSMRSDPKSPRIAYLSNISLRSNEMEYSIGNPRLKANRMTDQSFAIAYQKQSFTSQLSTSWRNVSNSYMTSIHPFEDGDGQEKFAITRDNQKNVKMFFIDNYTRIDALQGKLSFQISAGFYRFFNYGDDYKHHYSAFYGQAFATAYLGRFTLQASADSGWRFLEGENKSKQTPSGMFAAMFQTGKFNISLYWQNCFNNKGKMYDAELLNRYVHKTQTMWQSGMGNMVCLKVSLSLSSGRKYRNIEHEGRAMSTDDGIVRN